VNSTGAALQNNTILTNSYNKQNTVSYENSKINLSPRGAVNSFSAAKKNSMGPFNEKKKR